VLAPRAAQLGTLQTENQRDPAPRLAARSAQRQLFEEPAPRQGWLRSSARRRTGTEQSSRAGWWLPSSHTPGSSPETPFLLSSLRPSAECPALMGNLLPTLGFTTLPNLLLKKHLMKSPTHAHRAHAAG